MLIPEECNCKLKEVAIDWFRVVINGLWPLIDCEIVGMCLFLMAEPQISLVTGASACSGSPCPPGSFGSAGKGCEPAHVSLLIDPQSPWSGAHRRRISFAIAGRDQRFSSEQMCTIPLSAVKQLCKDSEEVVLAAAAVLESGMLVPGAECPSLFSLSHGMLAHLQARVRPWSACSALQGHTPP